MNVRTTKEILHFVLICHAALWVGILAYKLVLNPTASDGDWFVLREVARSFLAGDWSSIYSDRELPTGTYYFRYPPFVLYLIAPLALIPPMAAYVVVCATQLAAAAGTLWVLCRIRRPAEIRILIAGVFGSAALAHVVNSGQNSALLALVIGVAAYGLATGRNVLAGVCVGLLACKPNWLPVFAAFVLWRGGLRAGLALVLTAASLILSTLPLGAGLWREFFSMTAGAGRIAAIYEAYMEITLLASLKSVLGWTALAKIVWGGAVAVLTALVVRAVRDGRPTVRSVALVTLFAIVANPYVSFYDGFVLVVPATLWIANRDEYPARAWWIIGGVIATYWLWDMGIFYYKYAVPVFSEPRVSAAGIILTAWLLTEARARPLNAQL
jgi:hypothetical protein